MRRARQIGLVSGCLLCLSWMAAARGEPWPRHTIDRSSRGADGVRVLDVNADRLSELVTGWEEGGLIRVYLQPGQAKVKQPWPAVTVGRAKSPEDALLTDLDGDGSADVVTCTEGRTMSVLVHWAPKDRSRYLDEAAWQTAAFAACEKKSRWMFAAAAPIDRRHGSDLFVGSKQPQAMVGWLQAPADARDLAAWKLHPLYQAGWIMSLVPVDMDADGDVDLLLSDRKGPHSGVKWLENPGSADAAQAWAEHPVGGQGKQVMFLCQSDLDRDGFEDVICAVQAAKAMQPNEILYLRRKSADGRSWQSVSIASSDAEHAGLPKGVGAADLNGDGRLEILMTCEHADGPKSGVWAIDVDPLAARPAPVYRDLGGPEGVKFDLIQMLDLDVDGDLDLVTCEERDGLGVVWYENPK